MGQAIAHRHPPRFLRFFAKRPAATVLFEACGSAHHWARTLEQLGHTVRLLPPHETRRYVRRNKTDRADAKALLEAARNEEIHPVPVKSVAQQAIASLHRVRTTWVKTRTARLNTLRGLLREFGVTIPVDAPAFHREAVFAAGPCPDRVEVGSTVSLRAIVTPLPSGYVTAEVNGSLNGTIECSVGRTARTCGWRISQLSGSGTPGRFVSGDSVNLTWKAPSSPGSVTIGARYQIYVQGVGGFFPIPEHWSDNKGHAAGSNTLTFDVIEPTPPPDLRPHLSCDNGEPLPTDSSPRPNDPPRMGSCDSIDGADVEVTLTVTRPNGTTVSSLLYTVEWVVRGGEHAISSSHPTSTTSRANHLLTWSSTGLTTGGRGVVVAAARPNGYDYAFNSTQVTIIVKERDLPPVVSEIACTPRVTPQGDNPAVCTATLDATGGQGHLVDLSIDASDPNDDPLTYIWRAANGSFNGGVRTNQTTWDAAGLSPGQYTVTVTVAERITGGQERSVNVNVARYAPPVQGYVCTPDSGWENGTLFPMIGDPYCGQFHDTHISNFRWFTTEVGARGASEVTLGHGRTGTATRTGKSSWQKKAGVAHRFAVRRLSSSCPVGQFTQVRTSYIGTARHPTSTWCSSRLSAVRRAGSTRSATRTTSDDDPSCNQMRLQGPAQCARSRSNGSCVQATRQTRAGHTMLSISV